VADNEYPARLAQTLLTRICNDFAVKYSMDKWPNGNKKSIAFTELPAYLSEYKDLMEVDALTKLQGEVDAVIIILNNNVEALQNCGDNLLRRSDYISEQSNCFEKTKKTQKKRNCCCNLL
jgi:synaptobrevin homolog YKT6